jgi:hypothetical protein
MRPRGAPRPLAAQEDDVSNGNGNGSQAALWAAVLVVLAGAAGFLIFATGGGEEDSGGTTTVLEPGAAPSGTPELAASSQPEQPPVTEPPVDQLGEEPGPGSPDLPTPVAPIEPDAPPAPTATADVPIREFLTVHASDWQATGEQWAAMYLAGAKSGHAHRTVTREERDGVPVWVSTEEGMFQLDRGGAVLTIKSVSKIYERDDGQVVAFESRTEMGGPAQTASGTVTNGQLELTRMGRTTTHAYPEGALGPVAAHRRILQHVSAGEREFVIPSFSAEVPDQADKVKYTVADVEKVDLYGRVLMGQRVNALSSLMPMPASRWIAADGTPIQDQVESPIGLMLIKPCDEETAKSKNEPAEVFLASFVRPQREIKKPRKLPRAVYRLGLRDGALTSIYEGEGQTVLSRADGKLMLEVKWPEAPEGVKPFQLPAKIEGMHGFLAPNAFIESDDELVMSMAKEAVGDEKDALEVAVLIEDYVREKIDDKNLNVGFATAAEVARSCEGDCTEHGVLCAALARAVGLPARVVTGLAYLPPVKGVAALEKTGGFGFHMWTEVYVADGYWYPIDAAIGKFDGTHIALGKSDMAGASPGHNMTVETVKFMGKLTLEVVEPK